MIDSAADEPMAQDPVSNDAEVVDSAPEKRRLFRRRTTVAAASPDAVVESSDTEMIEADSPERIRPGVLRRRRRILLGQYEQGIFDLGGQVHQVDDQLDGIKSSRAERRQSGRGASITCPSCGARSKSGANFCAECGVPLAIVTEVVAVEQDTIVITDMPEQPTQVIASGADDPQATQAIPMPSESESKS